ncbi:MULTISPECIES: ABC transporter ATP-binding protein [Thermoactinomyces]|jgi:NitT/TauT family transport system ATP-binding protein|uniref:ABC transporter ATP-binding protein n=1 Tax=Thermoactinomyces vulgaris TaxID=2026 RepID=A0ABS0QEG6_THEVU|nr:MULTISPECIES: ABC transporter ATP-binding protein [Thermoactinomyces]KFZ41186.1 spermidine/putrescine ABC transporter ATP-binding protein [Thermoactinomyces sp. Gus2-1]KYQ87636.1 spermidine/putrescine ABC transporter ATP-binding protein [Thermoactinomyces sp. AS95]MBA4550192.1 ABC transporter ATP-binding protein [Thermoactinomyces vulgaris]MBA4595603.1 ABC transporter ATP-binding protein [Thermoactinomyces vulgaris]MBH8582075.1 ABC transporter ATP-binding protein [Thermoactinomyces sp. CICC
MKPTPAIQFQNVTHTFFSKEEEVTAIRDINFTVEQGETLVLVGPSGCGKSTILSLLAGIYKQTSGQIRLFGKEGKTHAAKYTGYMLQKDGLLEWRTVLKNMILGLEFRKQNTPERIEYALHLLKQMGLEHTSHQYPSQLSGGMRQRVALVRTLAVNPEILLLDEPFSALDIQNKIALEDLLMDVMKRHKKTAVLVTHDLEEALAVGDRILVMGGRPGTIQKTMVVPEEIRALSALKSRSHPVFRRLFEQLWQEVEQP